MSDKVFIPEKVRELIDHVNHSNKFAEYAIREWFEQNPITPQVVGLSDEQVNKLAGYIYKETGRGTKHQIVTFLKAQTFAEPNYEAEAKYRLALAESNRKLGDLQEELKLQQFAPNWDAAPVLANWIAIEDDFSLTWHELEPDFDQIINGWGSEGENGVIYNKYPMLFKRPQPTPKVEVGQIFHCLKNKQDYTVTEITTLEGETKMNDGEWEKGMQLIAYRPVKACEVKIYHRTLPDFLAKFERVL